MSRPALFVSDKRARRACSNLFNNQRVAHNDDAIFRSHYLRGEFMGYRVWLKPMEGGWRWLTEDEVHEWKV